MAQILLKQKGINDLILVIDQGVDGSRQLWPVTTVARRTERQRHGRSFGEAARGLW
jgi:hypothetical protein